jgi:hypothetical protein
MLNHAIDFYKNLSGVEENLGVHLWENIWGDEDKVTASENKLLRQLFFLILYRRGSWPEWFLFSFLSNRLGYH